jgi:hypothetical protein
MVHVEAAVLAYRERPSQSVLEEGSHVPAGTSRRQAAAAHSTMCTARKRSDCGIVRPSARAVLRLIIRSRLAGCSTGRSAGFAHHLQHRSGPILPS